MSQILPIAAALGAVCALGGVAVVVEARHAADRRSLWRAARLNLAYYFTTASFVTPLMLFAAPAIVALVNRAGGGFIRLPANGWQFALSVLGSCWRPMCLSTLTTVCNTRCHCCGGCIRFTTARKS
jgi:hypothetical protein